MLKHFLIALFLMLPLMAQPDPTVLGPLEVDGAGYRIDRTHIRGVPWATDIWGTVFFPKNLPGGPYPLVILLHGNSNVCRVPGTRTTTSFAWPPFCPVPFIQAENHAGYDYIAGHLASHGYIVASVNANAINARAAGIPERGHLVLEHLRYWQRWNSTGGAFPFGNRFVGKIDFTRVGLWGHSRGGEGVRAAYEINRREKRPFAIRAVMELGPVDFGVTNAPANNPQYNVADVPWSVVLPVCDRDVSDTQGMRTFDRAMRLPERANPSEKSQLYLWGANHNFGNDEWEPEDASLRCTDFPVITSREQQKSMIQVYSVGFFRQHLGGESQFRYLFSGDAEPPSQVFVPVHVSYRAAGTQLLMVDDLSGEAGRPNNAGGETVVENMQTLRCAGNACNDRLPADWYHEPTLRVLRVTWPSTGGVPAVKVGLGPDGTPKDVSGYGFLAFRAAARFDPSNPNLLSSQRLKLRLVDVEGKSAEVITDADREAIPFPTGSSFRRTVLRTLRIPVARFRGVDLTKVARIEMVFDQHPTGSVYLSDVHFTN